MTRLIACLALCSGCLGSTEIDLTITTDAACTEVTRVTIHAGDSASTPIASTSACSAGRIGDFVFVPSGRADSGVITVKMDLVSGSSIIATRSVRFVPHAALTLPIELSLTCAAIMCGPSQTCVRGACTTNDANH